MRYCLKKKIEERKKERKETKRKRKTKKGKKEKERQTDRQTFGGLKSKAVLKTYLILILVVKLMAIIFKSEDECVSVLVCAQG